MDIKRTVLWVVFSMSLLLLWDKWMQHNGKPSLFFPAGSTQQVKTIGASAVASAKLDAGTNTNASASGSATSPANASSLVEAQTTPAIQSETITITTDVIKADIDTVGGEIKRLELLKYVDSEDPTKNVVLFKKTDERIYSAQTGLLPFDSMPNHNSGFVAQPGSRVLGDAKELSLVLTSEKNGVQLTKTLTFKRGDYAIDVKHTVSNHSDQAITPSLYLRLIHDGTEPKSGGMFSGTTEFYAPAVYSEEKHFQKLSFETIEKNASKPDAAPEHVTNANNGWISIIQHFFVSAFIPQDKIEREITSSKVPKTDNLYAITSTMKYGSIAPGSSATIDSRLYSGPQESAILEKVATGLDLVKDYWKLDMIAKPMFWLMEFMHKFIGNWGWTIVFFTILIKLALFPLSAAGFRSMAKMKVLTPKMTALKERHKNEPQKLNQAMMELYKTEKINPLGGCLPMLIQMPIFLSLYWVLQASVEMRGAPWIGWIGDLSKPDPWFILPVLYAISMYITTKLSPAPADPVQAKMMVYMPLMFSVMFLFFPSGLVLYWVVNNILSIAQQWVINNKILPPEHRT